MSTQKITSGSVTYFVCECGNPPQYCKCSELARIAHLEQQAARLANLPGLPSEWQPPFQWGCIPTHIHDETLECLHDSNNRCMMFDCGSQTGKFIASLLNACYPPAPATGQEEGKA